MAYAFIALGLILTVAGCELLLRGVIGLSRALGLPPVVAGVWAVTAASCAPELAVLLHANVKGLPGLGISAVAGSVIAILLLILGLGALTQTLAAPPRVVIRDGTGVVLSAAAFLALPVAGPVPRLAGAVLLGCYGLYTVLVFGSDYRRPCVQSSSVAKAHLRDIRHPSITAGLLAILLGAVLAFLGGVFLVEGAIFLAKTFGLPVNLVALTFVALALALPKAVTLAGSPAKSQAPVAVSYLFGVVVFDLLAVLGIAALFGPLTISDGLAGHERIALLAGACLVPVLAVSRWRFGRLQGLVLMLVYGLYIGVIAWRLGTPPAMLLHLGP